ncbi:DNA-binding protein WhiA, partial [Gemella sp. GH3]|uniref:DNA-binding protein WhiA n=1 Tax=unclassified Gemella TaxID=2624949 RepID=UPI0015CF9024
DLYILNDDYTLKGNISEKLISDSDSKISYLRGAFLAGGSINNPRTSNYHLEIFSQYEEHNEDLKNILNGYNLNARSLERKKGFIVYIKESEKISEFIQILGASNALFQFEDERIVRDINNSVNRMQNCDLANMNKTVNASAKQVEDINIIAERLGLENLDDKLRVVAEARLKYPEYPLKEIAEIVEDGKLSKSGLNHRFRKLAKIAKDLREGTYEKNT